jgi:ribosomal protein L11 methylase PrmA
VDKSQTQQHASSFRDPAGFVFEHSGQIYRQINQDGADDYEHFISSGLYQKLIDEKLLVPHKEIKDTKKFGEHKKRYKVIQPDLVPFISYPYEWTFHQLKDAALLTLKVQKIALEYGMILKDSSAYNVQFIGKRPVFIDTLSFWRHTEGDPWEGYKQFCEHFVAPLAICAYDSPDILPALRVFLDGIPLNLTTNLLPSRARMRVGLMSHLYLHSSSQNRYEKLDESKQRSTKTRKVSPMALNGLIASLENTVKKLKLSKRDTQWGDYYTFTNYSDNSFEEKKKIVKQLLTKINPKTVWDMGANDGTFSNIAADLGAYTLAFDIDAKAVEQNYGVRDERDDLILPLVQDLSNPSPSLGWAHAERHSLEERGPADVTMSLALIHHLAISNHAPFSQIASFFARISKNLIIEFVPKGDSKVELLLSSFSRNKFDGYTEENFEAAFSKYFRLVEKKPVKGSKRVIYLYRTKS